MRDLQQARLMVIDGGISNDNMVFVTWTFFPSRICPQHKLHLFFIYIIIFVGASKSKFVCREVI